MEEQKKVTPVYYVNIASAGSNAYDFQLLMGMKKSESPEMLVEDIDVKLVMSPQHAKSLLEVLKQQVEIYEELYGVINLNADSEAAKKYLQVKE